jgi:hypothetical protein
MSDETQGSTTNPEYWPSSDDRLPDDARELIVERSAAVDESLAAEEERVRAAAADVDDINETPPEPAL